MADRRTVRRTQQNIYGESGAAVIQTQSGDFQPLHGFNLDHLVVETTEQNYPLGTVVDFADGRRFRYVRAAATVAKGTIACMNANAVFGQSIIPPNGVPQGTLRSLWRKSAGATTANANAFAGGILAITGSAGGDEFARIYSHEAVPAGFANTDTFEIELDPPGFRTALTTTSTALIAGSKYVVRAQGTGRLPVGLCVYEQIQGNRYGFVQTRGLARFKGAMTGTTNGDLLIMQSATALENLASTGEIPVARAWIVANKLIDLICE